MKVGIVRAMPQPNRQLKTFDEVVTALGGTKSVGQLCEDQDSAAVCNWKRRRKTFPTKYYIVMQDELEVRKASAPYQLWGFVESKRRR